VEPYLRIYFTLHDKAQHTTDEHAALLDALLSRNPERAEAVMREHVLSTAFDLVDVLRKTDETR
jgi:DNA-binding GntR family transcriptional regulator